MPSRRNFLKAGTFLTAVGTVPSSLAGSIQASTHKDNPTILLRSSWNDDNVGDIGHSAGTLRIMERHLPQARVILWHAAPRPVTEALIRKNFPRVQIVNGGFEGTDADAKSEVADAFRQADVYIHNSGMSMNFGLFDYEWNSTISKLAPFYYCLENKIPFGLYGHSFDKFAPPSQLLYRDVLSRAAFIYTRDTESLDYIKGLGFRAPIMEFGPDGCFGIDVRDEERGLAYLKQAGLEGQKFLTVVVRTNTPHLDSDGKGNLLNPTQTPEKMAEDRVRLDKLKAVITHWVRTTGLKVLIAPEALKETKYGKILLYDHLDDDVKQKTVFRDTFWNADEAMSVYARAHTIFGMEPHSLIMGLALGVPIIHARPLAHGRKGWMFRDIGLPEWLFDIDQVSADQLIDTLMAIQKDHPSAKNKVKKAMAYVAERQKSTMKTVASVSSRNG